MSEFGKDAVGFFIGCAAVAVVVFAFFGGLALVFHNGQAQTCATSGGHWVATDKPGEGAGDTGSVYRVRECIR